MSKKTKILLQLLGPVIFVYILFQIDYQLFFDKASQINWFFLLATILSMLVVITVRSWRWQSILSALEIKISKKESISLYWLGAFVGVVTPGRLGELIKVYFLKNKGYSSFRSFFSVILDRLIDVLTFLVFGLLIFFFFTKEIGVYILILGIGVLLAVIFILFLVDQRSFIHKIFAKIIKKIFAVNFKDYSRFTFSKFWQGIKEIKKKEITSFTSYFLVAWLFYFLARYLMALSLGLDLSFIEVSIISVLIAIITVLPISIAGLGTREAIVIYLFMLFNLDKETALLFSILIFVTDLIAISFGLIPYFKESRLVNEIIKKE